MNDAVEKVIQIASEWQNNCVVFVYGSSATENQRIVLQFIVKASDI